jgi:hypothetical protein
VRNAGMRSPEYKGTKGLGSESYEPPELQMDTAYYWRVDEYNTDAMISKGRIWTFTTVTEQGQTLSSQNGSNEPQQATEEQSETLIKKDLKEP